MGKRWSFKLLMLFLFLSIGTADAQTLLLSDLEKSDTIIYKRIYSINVKFYDSGLGNNIHFGCLARIMAKNKDASLYILNHTDNVGSPKYNEQLSLKRSQNLKKVLLRFDSTLSDRIFTKGYGMRYPLNANATEAERAENRRIEILFVNHKTTIVGICVDCQEDGNLRVYDMVFEIR